jgi:hypothetical protein
MTKFIYKIFIVLILINIAACKKITLSNGDKMKVETLKDLLVDTDWEYQYSINIGSSSFYYNKTLRFSATGDLIVNGSLNGSWTFDKDHSNKYKGVRIRPEGESEVISLFYYISSNELHFGKDVERVVFYTQR